MSYLSKYTTFNTCMITIGKYKITRLKLLNCNNYLPLMIFSDSSALIRSSILFIIQRGGTHWRYDSSPSKISRKVS